MQLREAYDYGKDSFKQVCERCGSKFKVACSGQKGHEEKEEYYCSICKQEFICRA